MFGNLKAKRCRGAHYPVVSPHGQGWSQGGAGRAGSWMDGHHANPGPPPWKLTPQTASSTGLWFHFMHLKARRQWGWCLFSSPSWEILEQRAVSILFLDGDSCSCLPGCELPARCSSLTEIHWFLKHAPGSGPQVAACVHLALRITDSGGHPCSWAVWTWLRVLIPLLVMSWPPHMWSGRCANTCLGIKTENPVHIAAPSDPTAPCPRVLQTQSLVLPARPMCRSPKHPLRCGWWVDGSRGSRRLWGESEMCVLSCIF